MNFSISIIGFVEIDEIGQSLKVILEIRREWFDDRLTILHLQEDQNLNGLWEYNADKIWFPQIYFENLDNSKDHDDRHLRYMILRDMNVPPIVRNPGTKNATNVFNGSEHTIVQTREFTNYWRCVYNLRQGGRTWQPFVGSKNGNANFRQARIYNFRVKCVVFARNRKFAKLTQ